MEGQRGSDRRDDQLLEAAALGGLREDLVPAREQALQLLAGRPVRGDRVGIAWLRSTCGACSFCTTGRENLCEASTYTGWTHDGGYATHCCVPEAFAHVIPPEFDDTEAAPLLCAGIIGYRALRRSQVPRGGRLALFGFGSSAHITLQVARHWGCTVYAVTRDAAHRRLALDLGARWAGGTHEALPERVDAAIVFAPAGGLVPVALQSLQKGGTVALAFALAHPERISKLVVSDAAAAFPPEGRQAFAVMAEKVAEGGLGSIAEIAAKRVFSPAYLAAHPEKIEERKNVLLAIDPKAFQAACKILQETDLVPQLHRLKVPTLVVCGEFDQATPPALNKQIVEKVAGARYIELPGCGHCPPLEQPKQFLAAIGDFVGL